MVRMNKTMNIGIDEAINECVKIQTFGVSEQQVSAMKMAIEALLLVRHCLDNPKVEFSIGGRKFGCHELAQ